MRKASAFDSRGILILGACILVFLISLFLFILNRKRRSSRKDHPSLALPICALTAGILSFFPFSGLRLLFQGGSPGVFITGHLILFISVVVCFCLCLVERKIENGLTVFALTGACSFTVYLFFQLLVRSFREFLRTGFSVSPDFVLISLSVLLMMVCVCRAYNRYTKRVLPEHAACRKKIIPVVGFILLAVSLGDLLWMMYIRLDKALILVGALLIITNGIAIAAGNLPLSVFSLCMLPFFAPMYFTRYWYSTYIYLFLICHVVIATVLIAEQLIRLYYRPYQRTRMEHTAYPYLEEYRSRMLRK